VTRSSFDQAIEVDVDVFLFERAQQKEKTFVDLYGRN